MLDEAIYSSSECMDGELNKARDWKCAISQSPDRLKKDSVLDWSFGREQLTR